MSHSLGVMCQRCQQVLVEDDNCGEGCPPGSHGYSYQQPGPYAARTWPQHPCFQEQ